MKFRRNFIARLYRNPEPGDDGSGGTSTPLPSDSGTAAAPAEPGAPAAASPSAPASMLDAMFGQKAEAAQPLPGETQEQTAQRLRDDKGRFAANPPTADGTAKPAAAAKPGEQQPAAAAAKPVDPLAMPEGLTPKAQERFQQLANTNKELTARVQEFEPIVNSARELQQTFQENGVRREQFDQAMQVVGLMNRGDLEGALRVIDEQRAMISMVLGRPVPGADALAKFPDLRQRVSDLQLSEADALEIARTRTQQQAQQATQQRQQAEQQQLQQSEQQRRGGQVAVDSFCKRMMQSDMDYAAIEPVLLEQIQGGLLEGIPPARWASVIEKTYGLIKQTAGTVRSQVQTSGVLRPTGGESPRQTPRTMHDAMWGPKA